MNPLRIGEPLEADVSALADGASSAVAADHIVGAHPGRSVGRIDLDFDIVGALRQAGDAVRKAHVEIAGVGVLRRDRGGHLVLLVLQREGIAELVPHQVEIEFGNHVVGDAIMEAIGVRDQSERDDLFCHAELVEHLQRRGMDRRRALLDRRLRLLLEYGDGYAAPVERERAHHPDRPCPNDDDARACFRCCHAGVVFPDYFTAASLPPQDRL